MTRKRDESLVCGDCIHGRRHQLTPEYLRCAKTRQIYGKNYDGCRRKDRKARKACSSSNDWLKVLQA